MVAGGAVALVHEPARGLREAAHGHPQRCDYNSYHNNYYSGYYGNHVNEYGAMNYGQTNDSPSNSKIVCTEMYRQTQLEDWAKAMKVWYIYQKKYLTPIHEVGYHWLFKPFVEGMKKSDSVTKLGAYLAMERTKHLKHVLTKGKTKDSVIGNIFCKIIHPIVYVAGNIVKNSNKRGT